MVRDTKEIKIRDPMIHLVLKVLWVHEADLAPGFIRAVGMHELPQLYDQALLLSCN